MLAYYIIAIQNSHQLLELETSHTSRRNTNSWHNRVYYSLSLIAHRQARIQLPYALVLVKVINNQESVDIVSIKLSSGIICCTQVSCRIQWTTCVLQNPFRKLLVRPSTSSPDVPWSNLCAACGLVGNSIAWFMRKVEGTSSKNGTKVIDNLFSSR